MIFQQPVLRFGFIIFHQLVIVELSIHVACQLIFLLGNSRNFYKKIIKLGLPTACEVEDREQEFCHHKKSVCVMSNLVNY